MSRLYLPFNGKVKLTSHFGWRNLYGRQDYHKGIDLVGADDITVVAPCDGIIGASTIITDKSNLTWQWGNYIRLDTSDGLYIFMCHLDSRAVKTGQTVKRGDKLGVMGNTGYSFGAHTHFEVRNAKGESLNPCVYLGIPNTEGIYENESEDDMTKEDVIAIIKEYEESLKKQSVPYGEEELAEAVELGITDGTRPCEHTPRFQTAIMCKRVYKMLEEKIRKLSAKVERNSADIGDIKAQK